MTNQFQLSIVNFEDFSSFSLVFIMFNKSGEPEKITVIKNDITYA